MIWLCILLLPLPCMTREYGHSYLFYRPSFSSLRKALISRTAMGTGTSIVYESFSGKADYKATSNQAVTILQARLLKAHVHLLDLADDPIAQYT